MPGVPEDTAEGPVAAVYAEYRALTGLARTPLLLRELATHGPDVLTAVWAVLRPHYAGDGLRGARRRLLDGLPLPTLRLAPAELADPDADLDADPDAGPGAGLLLRRVRVTLAMFAAANASNLVVMHLLSGSDAGPDPGPDIDTAADTAAGTSAGTTGTPDRTPDPSDDVAPLPLPEPGDLPPGRAEQVMTIARLLVDEPPPGWWPSLLLHLAPFPRLLDGVAREVDAHATELRALAVAVDGRAARRAAELAAGLRHHAPPAPLDADARSAADELAARYRRVLPPLAVLAACPITVPYGASK